MVFLLLGFFLWFITVVGDFVFSIPQTGNNRLHHLLDSLSIRVNTLSNVEFGISIGKMTGLLWIVIGLTAQYLFKAEINDFVSALVFLAPIWIGAFIWERRN